MLKKTLVLLLLFYISFAISAQQRLSAGPGAPKPQDNAGFSGENGEESASQTDRHYLGYWKYQQDNLDTFNIAVDTALRRFHVYNEIFKNSISNTFLGNYGSPYISNIYGDRESSDFLFSGVYRAYSKRPEDIPIINTPTPFTLLSYSSSGPKKFAEESVSILFSQNIGKSLNVGGYYDLIYGRGRYTDMSTRHRNYGLFSSYMTPRYQMVFNIGANRLENYENGGVGSADAWNDALINNQDSVSDLFAINSPEYYPVRMAARSFLTSNFISLKQKYNIGVMREIETADSSTTEFVSALNIVHQFDYNVDTRLYDDADGVTSYYDTTFIHSTATLDSVRQRKISNRLGLYLDEGINNFGKFGAGAYIQLDNYKMSTKPWMTIEDTMFAKGYSYVADSISNTSLDSSHYVFINSYTPKVYNNVIFGGSIFKRQGTHFFFDADGKICLGGYNLGDWQLKGTVKQVFPKMGNWEISANANFERTTPNYFMNHYYSNNFWWDNNLDPTYKQHLGGALKIPKVHFEASAAIDNMQNVAYYDTDALPSQYGSNMAVLALRIKKDFELGQHVVWENEVVYQETSASDVIPLPKLTVYSNLFFRHVLFGVLYFNVGVDCRYHTAYNAPGYMPATGQFYNQRDVQIGDYPYMNAYADFFLRRMRFFLMAQHVNYGWPNFEYFSAPHYGYNHRSFKLGLQWSFYD